MIHVTCGIEVMALHDFDGWATAAEWASCEVAIPSIEVVEATTSMPQWMSDALNVRFGP
jgi:hypothetical protein